MVLGKLGEQVVVRSQKAFESISFIEATVAPSSIYLPKRLARDTAAREEFKKEKNKSGIKPDFNHHLHLQLV